MSIRLYATPPQLKLLSAHHPKLWKQCTLCTEDDMLDAQPGDILLDLAFEVDDFTQPGASFDRLGAYLSLEGVQIVIGNVLESLHGLVGGVDLEDIHLYGVNYLPGFLEASHWEMTAYKGAPQELALPVEISWVADEVGMVTPRVLAMIINEAYIMLQEETASKSDIDAAMRLGVNYPKGPFEWAEQLPKGYVATLLNALQQETGMEKYAPCRLLRHERMLDTSEI